MNSRHLDCEYRYRREEYIMEDGTIYDSRKINWRDVKGWNNLKEIRIFIRDNEYLVTRDHKDFKYFVRFRNGGILKIWNKEKELFDSKVIHEWCFGWSNGEKVFMTVVDFKTGKQLPDLVRTVDLCINHIHPEVI